MSDEDRFPPWQILAEDGTVGVVTVNQPHVATLHERAGGIRGESGAGFAMLSYDSSVDAVRIEIQEELADACVHRCENCGDTCSTTNIAVAWFDRQSLRAALDEVLRDATPD